MKKWDWNRTAYDGLASLFILSGPYVVYMTHNSFVYEPLNLLVLGAFTVVAAAGALQP